MVLDARPPSEISSSGGGGLSLRGERVFGGARMKPACSPSQHPMLSTLAISEGGSKPNSRRRSKTSILYCCCSSSAGLPSSCALRRGERDGLAEGVSNAPIGECFGGLPLLFVLDGEPSCAALIAIEGVGDDMGVEASWPTPWQYMQSSKNLRPVPPQCPHAALAAQYEAERRSMPPLPPTPPAAVLRGAQ